jgi:hypothetical protein
MSKKFNLHTYKIAQYKTKYNYVPYSESTAPDSGYKTKYNYIPYSPEQKETLSTPEITQPVSAPNFSNFPHDLKSLKDIYSEIFAIAINLKHNKPNLGDKKRLTDLQNMFKANGIYELLESLKKLISEKELEETIAEEIPEEVEDSEFAEEIPESEEIAEEIPEPQKKKRGRKRKII